jgi:NADPH:quinone reductase
MATTSPAGAPTMRALVLEEFGAPLELRSVSRPVPQPGEVLVRIAASGVNPLDTKIRAGAAQHARVRVPAILGMDLAGVVIEVGPGFPASSPVTRSTA